MAEGGVLALVVAVLGVASLVSTSSPTANVRTTPAADGQSAAVDEAVADPARTASAGNESRTGRPSTASGGGKQAPAGSRAAAAPEQPPALPSPPNVATPVVSTTTPPPAKPAGERQIAFVRNQRIWVMNADGSDPAPLTDPSIDLGDPEWAPDGRRLVASKTRLDELGYPVEQLVVVDLDGAVRPITPEGAYRAPKWSPDGSHIAFARRTSSKIEAPKFDLWVMKADGSGERKLASETGWHFSWSPDGNRLAYTCPSGVCTVRPDGSDLQVVPDTAQHSGPLWSPDGSRLAVNRRTQSGGFQLVTIGLDGRDRRVVLEGFITELDWSPDGRSFVFASTSGCQCTRIWRIGADGSDDRPISDDGAYWPSWRPQAGS